MLGLMQHWPLTVDRIIEHAYRNFPSHEVVTRSVEGPIARTTYASIWNRSRQVTNALQERRIKLGDRVGTLAWNTGRHIELWYGAMGMGTILHTVNPRLFPQQIAEIINHAGDRILFFDTTFLPIIEKIASELRSVETYVALTDREHLPSSSLSLVAYEDFIAGHAQDVCWGNFEEDTACGLCYTTGTTGAPKGVLYSHRSNVLHSLLTNQPGCFGIGVNDVVLPVVPMFHANAWGLVFCAPMCGAKLVMPGGKLDSASIYELLETERVTFTAAVPTVWLMLLDYLRQSGSRLSTLKRIVIGGAAAPEAVLRAFEDDYGVEVIHAWGMTEMSPVGSVGTLLPETLLGDRETQVGAKLKQGRAPFMVEMKTVDDRGVELARDGQTSGRLLVRGPAVSRAYFKNIGARNDAGECLEPDGFFDTGDIATIDEYGYMKITDRAKDVIKSGGEWISSIDIENIAVGADGVACAAVIGVPHPKWGERPLLVIEAKPGSSPTKDQLLSFLQGKIAEWWLPDDVVVVDRIPIGATGKLNKLALREMLKDYRAPASR